MLKEKKPCLRIEPFAFGGTEKSTAIVFQTLLREFRVLHVVEEVKGSGHPGKIKNNQDPHEEIKARMS